TGQPQVDVVWQRYNPYESKLQVSAIPAEWVFIREEAPGAVDPDNEDVRPFNPQVRITSGLEEVLFPAPGAIRKKSGSELSYQPLVATGDMAGTVSLADIGQHQGNPIEMERARGPSVEGRRFTLAAWIRSAAAEAAAADEDAETDADADQDAADDASGEPP